MDNKFFTSLLENLQCHPRRPVTKKTLTLMHGLHCFVALFWTSWQITIQIAYTKKPENICRSKIYASYLSQSIKQQQFIAKHVNEAAHKNSQHHQSTTKTDHELCFCCYHQYSIWSQLKFHFCFLQVEKSSTISMYTYTYHVYIHVYTCNNHWIYNVYTKMVS